MEMRSLRHLYGVASVLDVSESRFAHSRLCFGSERIERLQLARSYSVDESGALEEEEVGQVVFHAE
jgi:hypothetical protein